jgi:hypothetical protein
MARRATAEEIRASGRKELEIPGMVDEAGEPLTVLVRKVHAGERMSLMPPLPASVLQGPPAAASENGHEPEKETAESRQKALEARERAWLESLTPAQKAERQAEANEYCYRLVALAAIEPEMTPEDARGLGDAALVLADQIQKFSANTEAAEKKPEPATA